EWKAAVEKAGFVVAPGSHAFTNPWLVANRYEGKAKLFREVDGTLVPLAWPVTNLLLVAEKRWAHLPVRAQMVPVTILSGDAVGLNGKASGPRVPKRLAGSRRMDLPSRFDRSFPS